MFKNCFRHNHDPVAQSLMASRRTGMSGRQDIRSPGGYGVRGAGGSWVCFLSVLIGGGWGVVGVEGKILLSSAQPATLVEHRFIHDKARDTEDNLRDPFKRVHKHRPNPAVQGQLHPGLTSVPEMPEPILKLLGVIHGLDGYQAIIQIAPKERVLVQAGSELARSGWMIKTISEDGVLLEHLSSHSAGLSSVPKTLILSFPAIRQTP
jgi:hypothetical protein